VNDIKTASLSGVQQVGTYTIPAAGKYQIRIAGESLANNAYGAAGGILIASKLFSKNAILDIKGIKSAVDSEASSGMSAGAGVGVWENGNIALVAGGGTYAWVSGGGYVGGYGINYWQAKNKYIYLYGYSWNGTTGSSKTYCSAANCNVGAVGGKGWHANDIRLGYGGTGYCGSGYTCTQIAGGNSTNQPAGYSAATYGNWWSALTLGAGYASIVYCGPYANSICPPSCGNTVSCTTGSCNYKTGLCE